MSNLLTRVSELIEAKNQGLESSSSSFLDFCESFFSSSIEDLDDAYKIVAEEIFSLFPQLRNGYPWTEGDLIDSEKLQNIEGKILMASGGVLNLLGSIISLEKDQFNANSLYPAGNDYFTKQVCRSLLEQGTQPTWSFDVRSNSWGNTDFEKTYWNINPLNLEGSLCEQKLYYLPVRGNGDPDTPTTHFSFHVKIYNYYNQPTRLNEDVNLNSFFSLLPKDKESNLIFNVVVPDENMEETRKTKILVKENSVFMKWGEEAGKWTGKTNINSYVSGIATIDPVEEKILFELGVTEKDTNFKKYPKLGICVCGIKLSSGVSAVDLECDYSSYRKEYSGPIRYSSTFIRYGKDSVSLLNGLIGSDAVKMYFSYGYPFNSDKEFQTLWFDNPYYEES